MTKVIRIAKWILLLMLVLSLVMIAREMLRGKKEQNALEELSQAALVVPQSSSANEEESAPAPEAELPKRQPVHDIAQLQELNSDTLCWLTIPDTRVDYPVMHTPQEPQKYLRLSFEHEYAISGVPFLQENCTLDSQNLVIYGHNMKNGTMFSDITLYADRAYCADHSLVLLETTSGVREYSVYAAACVKSNDPWYYFESASNPDQFYEKLEDISAKALYLGNNTPEYGQQLLTISTCYGANDDDRILIIAVQNQ
ncbi:MAG: class B sortase [Oscillospiraceae bacterium]|nr:class B sortase [Oscillospiraceae bacterium]